MSAMKKFVRVLNGLIVVAFAAVVILWYSNILPLGIFHASLKSDPALFLKFKILMFFLATLTLIFNVILMMQFIKIGRYDTHVRIKSENSEFSVAIAAIEETLTRAISTLPEIEEVRLRIFKLRKKNESPIKIVIRCSVWDRLYGKDLPEKIKAVVKQRFNEIVDVPTPPNYEVFVSKFVEKIDRKGESKKARKVDEEFKVFRGPEYPVEHD